VYVCILTVPPYFGCSVPHEGKELQSHTSESTMKTPERSVRTLAQIEAEVMAEGREWTRQRLEKELQRLADEQGEVFPPQRAAADSPARLPFPSGHRCGRR
jgi:hypothetical protein